MIEKTCLNCGETFLVKPYREDTAKYCSQKCLHDYIRGKPNLKLRINDGLTRHQRYYRRHREKEKARRRKYASEHREEERERLRRWRLENRERYLEYRRRWYREHKDYLVLKRFQWKWRVLTIVAQSADVKCVYCGCDDLHALEINHKFGKGKVEQRKLSEHGESLYSAIVRGERPVDDLEVVCKPCNARHYLRQKYGEEVDRWEIKWV